MSCRSVSLSPVWIAVLFYTLAWSNFNQGLCLKRKIRQNLSQKGKWNVLKVHSAKKLLTLSKSQCLLLPGCIRCRFTVLLCPSQAPAMPTARRTEGMRHPEAQVINPSQHPAHPSSQLTSLRRVSSSRRVLVHSSAVKGEHLTPNTAYISYNQFHAWEELKRSTCF